MAGLLDQMDIGKPAEVCERYRVVFLRSRAGMLQAVPETISFDYVQIEQEVVSCRGETAGVSESTTPLTLTEGFDLQIHQDDQLSFDVLFGPTFTSRQLVKA